MAWWAMGRGDLDEARKLLNFLEKPGAGLYHSLSPLDRLAAHFQVAQRHEEALELAAHLLRELPGSGQRGAFRKFVRKSEKAMGTFATILPPVEHPIRGLLRGDGSPYSGWVRKTVILAVVLALVAAGLGASSEYIRTHRRLHILNATDQAVQVSIDGGPATPVTGLGKLTVSEGRHSVRITGRRPRPRRSCWPRPILNGGGKAPPGS